MLQTRFSFSRTIDAYYSAHRRKVRKKETQTKRERKEMKRFEIRINATHTCQLQCIDDIMRICLNVNRRGIERQPRWWPERNPKLQCHLFVRTTSISCAQTLPLTHCTEHTLVQRPGHVRARRQHLTAVRLPFLRPLSALHLNLAVTQHNPCGIATYSFLQS